MSDSESLPSKSLPFSIDEIRNAVEKYETPFHLYNETSIRRNAQQLSNAFKTHWPSYRNYFAVKATPNPHLLAILKEEGMGADCSSLAELLLSERVGLRGNDIMFTSNNTIGNEYRKAYELGAIINLDDITHVPFLFKELGDKVPDMVCLRYNPGPLKAGNAIIGEPQQAKFGFTREQLFEAYEMLKKLGVSRFGLHCMVASNELQPHYFVETARILFDLVIEITHKVGIHFEFVNMGGGFGIPYRPTQSPLNYELLAKKIFDEYTQTIGQDKSIEKLSLVTECGRVVTGPYGVLVSKAIHHKSTYKRYLGIDACMANLMRPGMYGAYHHISIIRPSSRGEWSLINAPPFFETDVVGSLCENNDKFAVDRKLPSVHEGDIVVVHDSGAHGHSMGFNYNGKLRSAEILLTNNGDFKLIRRAETIDDLFATLDFSEFDKTKGEK
eukprot:TRINITY_DN3149_c0_g2_i1.p1 TRINITY_DN3149_c0_g2~~TRINITY_DN3149_c0_g2_i1.p1  ORF type:complete len:442 (-),score=79.66 TRINITY_DN3149_c0_g2_i1:155-1480(-)